MDQDEGRDQARVGRDPVGQDRADREVVDPDRVGDRVVLRIFNCFFRGTGVPARESRARCACHNRRCKCLSDAPVA